MPVHILFLQVCIYFHNKLYRGNRATKNNSSSFDAFNSPNLNPLAEVGIEINSKFSPLLYVVKAIHIMLCLVEWDAIHRPVETKKFCVHPEMNRNVGVLRIFPGITHATVSC